MAKQAGKRFSKKYKFFYLNDELHKVLERHRDSDLLVAWNYNKWERVAYNLSDVNVHRRPAYTIKEVSAMIGKGVNTIKRHMREGNLPKPMRADPLQGTNKPGQFYFSEDDIRLMREFFRNLHWGRPRKDGTVREQDMPSKAELEAMLRNETILYAKNEQGEYVPVWKAPQW
jgi:hypothetical protein